MTKTQAVPCCKFCSQPMKPTNEFDVDSQVFVCHCPVVNLACYRTVTDEDDPEG